MSARNPGMKLDLGWISKVRVNTHAVLKRAQTIQGHKTPKKQWQAAWLLKAVTCIDLTTLAGDDTPSNVHRLCLKAIQPVPYHLLNKMDMHDQGVTTAAVCVYPSRVADAVKSLKAANSSLAVASVATGFPAGQTPLETRLQEVRLAVADGATEIDIVINRTLALTGQWEGTLRPQDCSHVRGSASVPGGLWGRPHEDHPGCGRAGHLHQCVQGQPGSHDGRFGLHQDVHRKGVCQRHLPCRHSDGEGNPGLLLVYRP
ncbi:deoxyribose-phosphate aldolase isoform X2 [Sander vitreus]